MQDVEKIIKEVVEEFSKDKSKIKVSVHGRKVNFKHNGKNIERYFYRITMRPREEYIYESIPIAIYGKKHSDKIYCYYYDKSNPKLAVTKCFKKEELRNKLKEILEITYRDFKDLLEVKDNAIYLIKKIIEKINEVTQDFEWYVSNYGESMQINIDILDTKLTIYINSILGEWCIVGADITLTSIGEIFKAEKDAIINYLELNNIKFDESGLGRLVSINMADFNDSERLEVVKKLAEAVVSLYLI